VFSALLLSSSRLPRPTAHRRLSIYVRVSFDLMCTRAHYTDDDVLHLVKQSDSVDGDTQNYGVVIDAGSSGSRLFVYTWPPHTGEQQHLIKVREHAPFDWLHLCAPRCGPCSTRSLKNQWWLKSLLVCLSSPALPQRMHQHTCHNCSTLRACMSPNICTPPHHCSYSPQRACDC
jgi:hypothetical protein